MALQSAEDARQNLSDTEEGDGVARRRHAAGEDPAKREQILDGARQVFLEQGYDAASMNDICRAAGVSKGTIYVYFANKEELFVALVELERSRMFREVDQLLEDDIPIEEKLGRYGRHLAQVLCSDEVVRAQRIIIGIAERMPDLGTRFHEGVAQRAQARLARLFEREIAAGRLSVPDVPLAVSQFTELTTAGLLRPRLFGKMRTPPSSSDVDACVGSAVGMFLATYGANRR